jgi:hypothetical protein
MLRRALVPVVAVVLVAGLSSVARAQVKLEYKFPEESKSTHTTVVKVHQVLSIMGMDVETNADETIVTNRAVGKRKPDGTLPIIETIESIKAQIELPGGVNIAFDSSNPDAKIDNAQLAFLGDVFKALTGAAYTIVLDPQNKVKFVEGTEALEAKFAGLDQSAATVLKGRMSTERLKKVFEQSHGNLPEVLARPGEPWEATEMMDIGGDQTLTFRKRYEYLGTAEHGGKKLEKIGVKAQAVTYAMDPNSQSPVKATKSDLKVESSDGTLWFDREAGRVVDSQQVTRVKGDLTLVANEKELPSTLDLTLEIGTSLQKPEK